MYVPVEQADTLTSLAESLTDPSSKQQLSGIPGQLITITLPPGTTTASDQVTVTFSDRLYFQMIYQLCNNSNALPIFSELTIFSCRNLRVQKGFPFIIGIFMHNSGHCLWKKFNLGKFILNYGGDLIKIIHYFGCYFLFRFQTVQL